MANWLQRMEKYIGGGAGGPRRVKVFRWLILLGLLGAALILAASLLNVKPIADSPPPDQNPPRDEDAPLQQETFVGGGKETKDSTLADIESDLESRLKELLETIVGVGTVTVMITVESTEETVVQLNESKMQQLTDESDKNGATRHITEVTTEGQVVLYQVSSGQAPIVVKRLNPRIRGVAIVAKGAENIQVRKLIADTVSRGLDVPPHRISVAPRKT